MEPLFKRGDLCAYTKTFAETCKPMNSVTHWRVKCRRNVCTYIYAVHLHINKCKRTGGAGHLGSNPDPNAPFDNLGPVGGCGCVWGGGGTPKTYTSMIPSSC